MSATGLEMAQADPSRASLRIIETTALTSINTNQ